MILRPVPRWNDSDVETKTLTRAWHDACFNADAVRTFVKHNTLDEAVDQTWADAPKVGDVLGQHRLLELVGEGGMARVYRAEDVTTGRRVAVKVLSADRSLSLTGQRSFALEAEAAQRIAHTNVVTIHASNLTHAGFKYHVMEMLDGATLRTLMDREPQMNVERALVLGTQLADALAATHTSGYVHRDVKPENVVVVGDTLKLIDFGAAKDLCDAKAVAGEPIVGTPLYMAPEQMWGRGTATSTDVYAFGLLMYEMLAGKLPFKSRKFVELREERSTQDPTPLRTTLRERMRDGRVHRNLAKMKRSEVPAALEALIMACLARSASDRPESMAVVAERLRAITVRTPAKACTVIEFVPRRKMTVRKLAMSYAAAAAAVFLASSTLVSDMSNKTVVSGRKIECAQSLVCPS